MKKLLLAILLASGVNLSAQTPPPFTDVSASKVLVVYNDNPIPDNTYTARDYNKNNINDSKELAEYYQQKRGIPANNMLAVYPSWFEIYTDTLWAQVYWDDIVVPIKNRLAALGDTSIYYILLMEGIHTSGSTTNYTWGYSFDNSLVAINNLGGRTTPNLSSASNPVLESTPGVSTDKGQFNHNYKVSGTHMYPVSRITSWDLELEKNIIDMSLYGEKYIYFENGYYYGNGYIDTRYGHYDSTTLVTGQPYYYNSYNSADMGMALTENYFKQKNIPYKYESSGNEIGANTTMLFDDGSPADSGRKAMLYAGWYNFYHYYNVWDWMPGSFACDLNSSSAARISYNPNSYNQCWLTNAFGNGLTCATGVYNEPYVNGHSRSNTFLYYFLNGYNFIESAIHAEPYLKWEGAVLGDPLYNPFKAGKIPVKDLSIEPSVISYDFMNDSMTNIHLDYASTLVNPEVVKAVLYWGTSAAYTDTIHRDTLYFAHHNFKLDSLSANTEYHFKICVIDPVGNTWCSADQFFKTDGTIGVLENLSKNSSIAVFPNPGTGNFQLNYELKKSENILLTVYNTLGQEVYSEAIFQNAGSFIKTIDLSKLSKGVYSIKLASGSFTDSERLVIE